MIEQIKQALPEIENHLSISTVDYLRDVRYLITEVEAAKGNALLWRDKSTILQQQVEEMQKTLEDIAESDDEWYVGRMPMREYARQTLQSIREDKPNDHKPML